jgi:hypothetical protein
MAVCAAALLLSGCATSRPWKFAVMSDVRQGQPGEPGCTNGVHSEVVHALAADAAKQGIKLVVFPGDLINGGTNFGTMTEQLTEWRHAMAPLYEAGVPVYPVRGNHEMHQEKLPTGGVKVWRDFFPELPDTSPPGQEKLTYVVKYKNASFVGFDEYVERAKTYNAKKYDDTVNHGLIPRWAIDQVSAAQTPWVFAFGHEMAFFGNHTDCLANAPAERDALWDALGARHGVYLTGHDHMYIRREAPDIANRPVLELVVGDGGAPPYPYANSKLNVNYDRHVVPTDKFVNAGGPNAATQNTNGYPMYFGYVVVTVKKSKLQGEWRAMTNFDTKTMTFNSTAEPPKFEALDKFVWAR